MDGDGVVLFFPVQKRRIFRHPLLIRALKAERKRERERERDYQSSPVVEKDTARYTIYCVEKERVLFVCRERVREKKRETQNSFIVR